MTAPAATWLPDDFEHPIRADLSTGHHLRPMGAADTEIDFPVVMGSRERLWSIYGAAWGWPPAHMMQAQDREDLAHHEREIAAHQSFLYGLFDDDEAAVLGCVYVDPPEKAGDAGAEVSWWVVDRLVGSEIERALDEFVPRWLAGWPMPRPRYVGRDLTWAEWLALPGRDRPSPASDGSSRPADGRDPLGAPRGGAAGDHHPPRLGRRVPGTADRAEPAVR